MTTFTTGTFTSTGTAFNLAIESAFDQFNLVNLTDSLPANQAAAGTPVMLAYYASQMAPGSAFLNLKTNNAPTLAAISMIGTQGFTTWDSSNPPVFASTAVTAITAASPAVVTSAAHGLVAGDTVLLSQLNGSMTPMSGQIFTVNARVDANNFSITFDTSAAAAGQIGNAPATAGFATKVYRTTFSPANVVIGPTAVIAAGNQILLDMATVPSVSQGASQYTPFETPYQVGAKLRFYLPAGFNTSLQANFIQLQITQINTIAGYAIPSHLQCTILPGGPSGSITSAAGLAALIWPAGGANYASSYPLVTDIAEASAIFSEAEDNTGFRGITIGTGVQTNAKTYQWFAQKGYTLPVPVAPGN